MSNTVFLGPPEKASRYWVVELSGVVFVVVVAVLLAIRDEHTLTMSGLALKSVIVASYIVGYAVGPLTALRNLNQAADAADIRSFGLMSWHLIRAFAGFAVVVAALAVRELVSGNL